MCGYVCLCVFIYDRYAFPYFPLVSPTHTQTPNHHIGKTIILDVEKERARMMTTVYARAYVCVVCECV